MQGIIITIIVWVLGSALARVMVGAGLAFGSYTLISDLVDQALLSATNLLGALGPVGTLMYLAGVGEALSILGGAVLASVAFMSARVFLLRN